MGAHVQSEKEKLREYFTVFGALFGITILEVGATFLPGSKILRDVVIVTLACIKAGAVGYYYMHLKHETKWLRIVALCPIIMAVYAAVLVPDTRFQRPISPYLPLLPRVFPQAHHDAEELKEDASLGDEAAPAPDTAHDAAPVQEVNAHAAADSHGAEAPAAAPAAPAEHAAPAEAPAAAPAAGGGAASDSADAWR